LTKQERHHESDQDFPIAGGWPISRRVLAACAIFVMHRRGQVDKQ
jgi:hypothetical protein